MSPLSSRAAARCRVPWQGCAAQPDQPDGAAIRRVQPPEQFHPARLGEAGYRGQPARIRVFGIGVGRGRQRRRVEIVGRGKMVDQRLELCPVHGLDSVQKPRGIDKRGHLSRRRQHGVGKALGRVVDALVLKP